MFKKILLSIITLGIYPIVSKARSGKFSKTTKKYRDDGSLRKEVDLSYEFNDDESPTPPVI